MEPTDPSVYTWNALVATKRSTAARSSRAVAVSCASSSKTSTGADNSAREKTLWYAWTMSWFVAPTGAPSTRVFEHARKPRLRWTYVRAATPWSHGKVSVALIVRMYAHGTARSIGAAHSCTSSSV
jgi:hypothetical protein